MSLQRLNFCDFETKSWLEVSMNEIIFCGAFYPIPLTHVIKTDIKDKNLKQKSS